MAEVSSAHELFYIIYLTMKRMITMIVLHCSATRCNRSYSVQQLYHDHVEVNRWSYIGYHEYILRSGKVEPTRALHLPGAHAKGFNAHSIGVCYEGGLDEDGNPADTRTPEQKVAMARLIVQLHQQFPTINRVLGHRDLPDVHKACPCFDATELQCLLKVRNMDELDVWLAQHQEWVRGEASLKEESEANLRKENSIDEASSPKEENTIDEAIFPNEESEANLRKEVKDGNQSRA